MPRTRTRTRKKRKRSRRETNKPPTPNLTRTRNQTNTKPDNKYDNKILEKLRKIHQRRTPTAQKTDEAMPAKIAETPQEWIKQPNRRDIPGVDYPTTIKQALRTTNTQPQSNNPFKNPSTSKQTIKPILNKYLEKLDIKTPVKLRTWNRGHPARVKIYKNREKTPEILINYKHYQQIHPHATPKQFKQYLEYSISHELAHIQQYQDKGWEKYRQAKNSNLTGFEYDADKRATQAMNKNINDITQLIQDIEKTITPKNIQLEEKPQPLPEKQVKQTIKQIINQKPATQKEITNKLIKKYNINKQGQPSFQKQTQDLLETMHHNQTIQRKNNKYTNQKQGFPTNPKTLNAKNKPHYHIETTPTKSRGNPAIKYKVTDTHENQIIRQGTREYRNPPTLQTLKKELAQFHHNNKPVNPDNVKLTYNPQQGKIQSITRPGKYSKYQVTIQAKDKTGTRQFNTYKEALEFIQKQKGTILNPTQGHIQATWKTPTPPPRLPKELATIQTINGKHNNIIKTHKIDPNPIYQNNKWLFKLDPEKTTNKTYTINQLKKLAQETSKQKKQLNQKRKHNITYTRPKKYSGEKRKQWDQKTQPITLIMTHLDTNSKITATKNKITAHGLNPQHTTLLKLETPNTLNIPPATYTTKHHQKGTKTSRKYPEKLTWDNVTNTIKLEKKHWKDTLELDKTEKPTPIPKPKINYKIQTQIPIKKLNQTLQKTKNTHITLQTQENQLQIQNKPIAKTNQTSKNKQTAHYNTANLRNLTTTLEKLGLTKIQLEYSQDMPLHITAKDNQNKIQYWQAPLIQP